MTLGPGLQLDLSKGKVKEVVSVESPAFPSSITDNSPKDDNNDNNDDATI
ncbi:unnamed protein product [Diplocarpon coronariae]